jgi:hypothetical protein
MTARCSCCKRSEKGGPLSIKAILLEKMNIYSFVLKVKAEIAVTLLLNFTKY